MKTTLVTPCVNLNGTDKASLIRQTLDIMAALDSVEQALARAMPHGRDYSLSPINGERLDARARDAFIERARAIRAMHDEFEALALSINSQGR